MLMLPGNEGKKRRGGSQDPVGRPRVSDGQRLDLEGETQGDRAGVSTGSQLCVSMTAKRRERSSRRTDD